MTQPHALNITISSSVPESGELPGSIPDSMSGSAHTIQRLQTELGEMEREIRGQAVVLETMERELQKTQRKYTEVLEENKAIRELGGPSCLSWLFCC